MRLSWNEIRVRAAAFAAEWADAHYEKGETQSFYNDLFEVFGIKRRRVASFEEPVRLLGDRRGFLDLFWKGVLLVEQKSAGRDLTRAKTQALDYFPGLKEAELPRYLLISDFQTFELYDLDDGTQLRFALADLPQHVEAFSFIVGVQKRAFRDQAKVNMDAAALMGNLHDALNASGYTGHDLERLLVRLLFCLFADDTGIFEIRDIFESLIRDRTREDGSDTGAWLSQLFEILNTPEDRRQTTLDEDLKQFPYVNGELFAERLPIPAFNSTMRERLLEACGFAWDAISPAIFGSLFQFVMNSEERRKFGAHYTTEKNIQKVIGPLFMDDLQAQFARLKARRDSRRRTELQAFHRRLGEMTFFDPACGCGNFLIVAYRELRTLEIELIREIRAYSAPEEQQELDATELSVINVDQFYGIEVSEFPARIAETALWMMDHIMNNRLSLEFGQVYVRIPLRTSPHILVANALAVDWEMLLPATDCTYILGNPPFVGHQWRNAAQQADMAQVWGNQGQVNRLDYVTCWFKKAMEYAARNRRIEIAFVSTNSITQGEQCGILWPVLLAGGLSIRFAHRTFQWNSEARGAAAVHVVIIGLTFVDDGTRLIYEYNHVRGDPHVATVSRINGYLIEGPQYALPARTRPPAGQLQMYKGSQPTDGARLRRPGGGYIIHSNLILDNDERARLLAADPACEQWLRPFVGSDELISGEWRWCLWLKGADPTAIRASRALGERLERVRQGRLQSPTASVRAFAQFPTLFTQDRQPAVAYLAVPEVSSGLREYIPIAFLSPEVIASNKLQIIPGATLVHFGMLTSAMHMAWVRTVGGRLKSDYSYAPAIYNSFPWPLMSPAQEAEITGLAQTILETRQLFGGNSLDVLYDIDSMPPELRRAHNALDRAVDRLYRRTPFAFERDRVEHLFSLYEQTTAPLNAAAAEVPRRRRRMRLAPNAT